MKKMAFPKPKRKPKSRSVKKKARGAYCPERLKVLHGGPCVVCKESGNVHHVHDGGEPPDDYLTISLCPLHHQGSEGIHTLGRGKWEREYNALAVHLKRTDEWLKANGRGDLVKG